MGLELKLTNAQLKLIMSRSTTRGYIFVREENETLVATKVVPARSSDELVLLSELDAIDAQVKHDEAGYIPYIFGGRAAVHEKCAFRLYHDNEFIARFADKLGLPSFSNKLKGYGEVGEYDRTLKVQRFAVNHEGVIINEDIKIKICGENGA